MIPSHHTPLAVIVLLVAPLTAAADGQPAPQASSTPMNDQQQLLLLKTWELLDLSADGVPEADILSRLTDVAVQDPRPVFEVYAGLESRPQSGPAMPFVDQQRLLSHALHSIDIEELLSYVIARNTEGSAPETRLRSLELLSTVSDSRAAGAILSLLEGFDPLQLASGRTRQRVEAALRAALELQPHCLRTVAKDPESVSAHLLPFFVEAAPLGGEGAELALSLLGLDVSLDRRILERLRRAAQVPLGLGSGALHGQITLDVRERLRHPDAKIREQALLALGVLVDPESIPDMIDLLEDPDASVRRAARWGLEEATGQHLANDVERWYTWYDDQLSWYLEHSDEAERSLIACSDAQAIAIIRDLTYRPLFRHRFTEMLAPLLFRESNYLVNATTSAMKQLESPTAVEFLIDGLAQADPACRQVIHETLMEISGLELPAAQADWFAAFHGTLE